MSSLGVAQLGRLYRDNRTVVWLCVVIFVNQLGFGAIIPAVPLYAREFGVSQTAIGLTLAVYGFARFIANFPTGQLSDRIGRRWTLVLGEIVTAVGNLGCGFSGSYELFLVFRFVSGLGAAMVVTSGQVLLADISTRANRGRMVGAYYAAFLFGVGFGPFPGGLLADRLGLSTPFFAFAALGVLAAALTFDKIPETLGSRPRGEAAVAPVRAASSQPAAGQLKALVSQSGFALISLVAFVQFFARSGGVFTVAPILGAAKLGLSPDQIGLGLTLVALPDLVLVYLSGMLADRIGRKPVIVPSALMSALSLIAFAAAPSFGWFVLGMMMWGLSMAMGGTAPATYAADMAPPGMNAATLSTFRTVGDFGYVVGPLLLGWTADVAGGETALLLTAGMFVLSSLLFALFAPETKAPTHRRLEETGSRA